MLKFKVGDKVKIIADNAKHGISLGKIVIITQVNYGGYSDRYLQNINDSFVLESDITFPVITAKELARKKKELNKEISFIDGQLNTLKELNANSINPTVLYAYTLVKDIDKAKTLKEKVALLSGVIK